MFSEFHALKDYITQAEESQFPECDLLDQLRNHIIEAEQCSQVANQLLTKKHKSRYLRVLMKMFITKIRLKTCSHSIAM